MKWRHGAPELEVQSDDVRKSIAVDLAARLRRETADLHTAVEEAAGLPHSVGSRSDYLVLLRRLLSFHASVESALADTAWSRRWVELGIDLPRYRRSALLFEDLAATGAPVVRPVEFAPFSLSTFGAALGCLYVVEGSALGGRVIAPAIRRRLGEVSTLFFDGAGRGHPSAWRDLRTVLQRYGESQPDLDDVVGGARATFIAFQTRIAPSQEAVSP